MTVGQAQAVGLRPYLPPTRPRPSSTGARPGERREPVGAGGVGRDLPPSRRTSSPPRRRRSTGLLDLADGAYRVRIYRTDWNTPAFEYTPMMNGKRLPYIPFVLIGRNGETIDPQKPAATRPGRCEHVALPWHGRLRARAALHGAAHGGCYRAELQAGQSLKIGSSRGLGILRGRGASSVPGVLRPGPDSIRSAWSARRA